LELMGLGFGDWGLGIGDWRLGIGDWGLDQNGFVKHKTKNWKTKTLKKLPTHGCPTPPYPLFDTPPPVKPPRKISVQVTVGFVVARRIVGKVWLIFVEQD